jgi:hypothetical protein
MAAERTDREFTMPSLPAVGRRSLPEVWISVWQGWLGFAEPWLGVVCYRRTWLGEGGSPQGGPAPFVSLIDVGPAPVALEHHLAGIAAEDDLEVAAADGGGVPPANGAGSGLIHERGGQGIDLDLEAAAFLRHLLNLYVTQGLWKTLRMGLLGRVLDVKEAYIQISQSLRCFDSGVIKSFQQGEDVADSSQVHAVLARERLDGLELQNIPA